MTNYILLCVSASWHSNYLIILNHLFIIYHNLTQTIRKLPNLEDDVMGNITGNASLINKTTHENPHTKPILLILIITSCKHFDSSLVLHIYYRLSFLASLSLNTHPPSPMTWLCKMALTFNNKWMSTKLFTY